MKRTLLSILVFLLIIHANAQPYTLKSAGEAKAFQLTIYYGTQGKGAFVQYLGRNGIIPLQIKRCTIDSMDRESGRPIATTYLWEEVINGQVTGSYGLTQGSREITGTWYQRKKDGKRYSLEPATENPADDDSSDKYLLHGALLSFHHFNDNQLTMVYPDSVKKVVPLPDSENPDGTRQSTIADYNFDGYDDIAFSVPDAGMGVYHIFSIWLYDPVSRRFEALSEPDYSRSNCSGLYDISIDSKRKLLFSSCRGGARWWRDVYRFASPGKLVFVKTSKEN